MTVDIARFWVGDLALALEISDITGLVDSNDPTAIQPIDLGARWGVAPALRPKQIAMLASGHGALSLGDGATFETWDRSRVCPIPNWVAARWPKELHRLCGLGDDGRIVLVIDPARLGADPDREVIK